MAIPSSVVAWSPSRCFISCTLQVKIHSIKILSMGYSSGAATQSITCKFTHVWTALTWIAATCLCILSLACATAGSCASALPMVPTVTPSRIDFTTSASSFYITLLRAFATASSLLSWYLILNVNPANDSYQWCWVGSKLGVAKM